MLEKTRKGRNASPDPLRQLKSTTPSLFTRQPGSLVSVLIIYKHLLTDKPKETLLPNIAVLSKYARNPIIIVLLK